MVGKLAVVAIGGNSLIQDPKRPDVQHQWEAVEETCTHIAQMIADGRALLVQAEKVSADYRPAAEGAPSKAELDASIDQVKSNLDSMSEMGEMESLRLQMAMDRMSKMMSTLSNMLKKISDTAQGITQNIK